VEKYVEVFFENHESYPGVGINFANIFPGISNTWPAQAG
jgi:hypothetical protein